MIKRLFTVFDSKSEVYMPPFTYRTKGEAIRAFTDSVNDSGSQMNKYPADFTLFDIGSFDDVTCKFDVQSPESIGNAIEFVVKDGD
jgi:hypothetical protein